MSRNTQRDFYGYIPGFAVIVVALATVALAPSYLPGPLRNLLGLDASRVVAERPVGDDGTYAFLATQSNNKNEPVGYDPCKTIKVEVNPAGGPAEYRSLVDEALAHAGDEAGLQLEDVGTTDERPHWQDDQVPIFGVPRSRPVLISWADEDEVPQLAGRTAGIGGSLAVADSSGRQRYVTGGVTLDTDVYDELMQTPKGRAEARAILLHELGHVLGLAHVEDPAELMYSDNVGLLDYGPGDLAGLARVGRTPCA